MAQAQVPERLVGYNLKDVTRQKLICKTVVDANLCDDIDDCNDCIFHTTHMKGFLEMESEGGFISADEGS